MDPIIDKAITACEAFIEGKDDALSLPREAAAFVYTLLRATGAKRALEIGTSYGYSGLWIGAAMQTNDGQLITIDKQPHKTRTAEAYFADAGLADVIRCEAGIALDVIEKLRRPAPGFDFILIDADKANCTRYVEVLLPKLAPKAVIVTDNTLTHTGELDGFVSWMRRHPRFVSTHIPIGNGFEMSVAV